MVSELSHAPSRSLYADQWNTYVETFAGDGWPGDEWGTEANRQETFERLFPGVASWERAVEIGSGAGKYTEPVLRSGNATVHAFDVSDRFLDVLANRLGSDVASDRLRTTLLDGVRPDQMYGELEQSGWVRQVDALYSIDAMVHVDLQFLAAYLLTAGLVLRQGGFLIVTLADVTTNTGFAKLMTDIRPVFPRQVDRRPTAKFEWLSPDAVHSVLDRLGFRIIVERRSRDYEFVAELVRPEAADQLRAKLLG